MVKKLAASARTRRKAKYFELHERGSEFVWRAYKKKKGFYLWAGEEGEIAGPCKSISEALWEGGQYGGEYVDIDTNVQLEELFDVMDTNPFEPLLNNLSELTLNGVEIDAQSFKNFVIWHAKCRKASSAKKIDPAAERAP
jgi:hypothetical protein